jgi:leucyl aminopeptidase
VITIEFVASDSARPADGALAVLALDGPQLAAPGQAADAAAQGALTRAMAGSRFKGGKGQTLEVLAPVAGGARLLAVGAGPAAELAAPGVEQAAAQAFQAVRATGVTTLTLALGDRSPAEAASAGAGIKLAAYRFDKYRTTEKAEAKTSVTTVRIETSDPAAARSAFAPLSAEADGVNFTRDLVSEPANVLYPAEFAARVKALESMGLEVEIFGEAQLAEMGLHCFLSVGQGSDRETQMAVIQWKGADDPAAQPIAFVGKGVCFDTGGISLKPAEGMEDMKWDMGGAGAVAGLMHALAGRKAKVNAVGVLGLVENMPDGKATRPGDIVNTLSGQTVEIINTDAEGRLVLADCLTYTRRRFNPKFMIDLATLTGAIIISLGHDYAGLFSNDDGLSETLLAASKASQEALWRMPLPAAYEKQLDSLAADMKNIGGRPAGSITAALFLQRFVDKTPWAHLDIAAVAWRKPSSNPLSPEGATGFGVRLLNRMVADSYEG